MTGHLIRAVFAFPFLEIHGGIFGKEMKLPRIGITGTQPPLRPSPLVYLKEPECKALAGPLASVIVNFPIAGIEPLIIHVTLAVCERPLNILCPFYPWLTTIFPFWLGCGPLGFIPSIGFIPFSFLRLSFIKGVH